MLGRVARRRAQPSNGDGRRTRSGFASGGIGLRAHQARGAGACSRAAIASSCALLAGRRPSAAASCSIRSRRAARSGRGRAQRFRRSTPSRRRPRRAALIEERGGSGLAARALVSRLGLAAAAAAAVADVCAAEAPSCASATAGRDSGDRPLERRSRAPPWASTMREQPLDDGLPREEARERSSAQRRRGVFEHVLQDWSRRAGSSRASGSRSPGIRSR